METKNLNRGAIVRTGTLAYYPDGTFYEGEYHGLIPHGTGRVIYPDGAVYEGEWHTGRPHGTGRGVYQDGTEHEGEWSAGKPVVAGADRAALPTISAPSWEPDMDVPGERHAAFMVAMAAGRPEDALAIARLPCPASWPEDVRNSWGTKRDIARMAAAGYTRQES